jgi:hypothetical protein
MCLIGDIGQFRVSARRTNADRPSQFPRLMAPSGAGKNSLLVRLFVLCVIFEQLPFGRGDFIGEFSAQVRGAN